MKLIMLKISIIILSLLASTQAITQKIDDPRDLLFALPDDTSNEARTECRCESDTVKRSQSWGKISWQKVS